MTSPSSISPNKTRISSIDGLRGLCALSVAIAHFGIPTNLVGDLFYQFLTSGGHAVQIFFVVSGFLLARSISKFSGSAKSNFRNFIASRFFRIYPLWAVVVTFVFLSTAMPLLEYWQYLSFSIAFLFYEKNPFYLTVSWSLFVEEIFYFLVGISLFFRTKLIHLVIAFVLFLELHNQWQSFNVANYLLIKYPDFQFYFFINNLHFPILGFIFGKLSLDEKFSIFLLDQAQSYSKYIFDLLGVFYFISRRLNFGFIMPLEIATTMILISTLIEGTVFNRLSKLFFLRWIGIRCYCFYLIHQQIFLFQWPKKLLHEIGITHELALMLDHFIIVMALTLLITWASWKYFEEPIIRYGKKICRSPVTTER